MDNVEGSGQFSEQVGADYWTEKGERKKSGSSDLTNRVFLTGNKHKALAVRILKKGEERESLGDKLLNKFKFVRLKTHINFKSVDTRVNIMSLAKRLNTSALKIIGLSIVGKLDEFVVEQAKKIERQAKINYSIEAVVREEFQNLPEKKIEQKIKSLIETSKNVLPKENGNLILKIGNTNLLIHKFGPNVDMYKYKEEETIGVGSSSDKHKVTRLGQYGTELKFESINITKLEISYGQKENVFITDSLGNEYKIAKDVVGVLEEK